MDCRRAKVEIALWVRQDCDGQAERRLEQHLARCPDCRAYRAQLQRTFESVQEAATESCRLCSVWPRVAARLSSCEESWRRSQFNGWVPALAMTAACVMLFVVATDRSRPRETGWPAPRVESAPVLRIPTRLHRASDLAPPLRPQLLRDWTNWYFRVDQPPPEAEVFQVEVIPVESLDRADF